MATHGVVDVLGQFRRLFSLKENNDGTVMVLFGSAEFMGDGHGQEHEDKRIKNQKYSIHPSPTSPQQINMIKYELILENFGVVKERHATAAMKVHDRFAPVGFVLAPDLRPSRYLLRFPPSAAINFGYYDPENFLCIYGIFVGPRDKDFSQADQFDVQIKTASFSHFKVVAMCSFVELPASPIGARVRVRTTQPDWMSNDEMGAALRNIKGLDAAECVDLFRQARSDLVDRYVELFS